MGEETDFIAKYLKQLEIVPLQIVPERQDKPLAIEENEPKERALLYVSATRAKKDVLVTSFGKKSRFLCLIVNNRSFRHGNNDSDGVREDATGVVHSMERATLDALRLFWKTLTKG